MCCFIFTLFGSEFCRSRFPTTFISLQPEEFPLTFLVAQFFWMILPALNDLKLSLFNLTFKGHSYWIHKSRMTFAPTPPPALWDGIPVSSCIVFWWKFNPHSYHRYMLFFSPLAAFKIFYLSLVFRNLRMMWLGVVVFVFILLRACWTSLICGLTFLK